MIEFKVTTSINSKVSDGPRQSQYSYSVLLQIIKCTAGPSARNALSIPPLPLAAHHSVSGLLALLYDILITPGTSPQFQLMNYLSDY